MIIELKSTDEIELMAKAGDVLKETKEFVKTLIKPGISTGEIDAQAEEFMCLRGVKPAFKKYRGFPSSLCISINEEIVHGIPSFERIIQEGDIVSVDMGSIYKGYHGDTAITVPVGEVSDLATKLIKVAEMSLESGISKMIPGNLLKDVIEAIENTIKAHGFFPLQDFSGHGIGVNLHEQPTVLNYISGHAAEKLVLREGLVLALEPMVLPEEVKHRIKSDGWTVVTENGCLSSHAEHTIAITSNGPRILT